MDRGNILGAAEGVRNIAGRNEAASSEPDADRMPMEVAVTACLEAVATSEVGIVLRRGGGVILVLCGAERVVCIRLTLIGGLYEKGKVY